MEHLHQGLKAFSKVVSRFRTKRSRRKWGSSLFRSLFFCQKEKKVAKNEKFIKGINRIEKGLEKGYRIALMCTEKEPIECHRTILVSRNLFLKGMVILHILSDGTAVYHEKIEEELVEKYFPNRNQLSLFDMNETIDYLKEAYKKANNDIGYRKEDDDE